VNESIRKTGAIKLLGWGVVACLGGVLVYWLNAHWHRIPVGGGLIAIGIPGALALTGFLELLTGHPFLSLASEWDQLAGWQRGILGMLVAALALTVALFGMVLFG
jgi:hypothetical protein